MIIKDDDNNKKRKMMVLTMVIVILIIPIITKMKNRMPINEKVDQYINKKRENWLSESQPPRARAWECHIPPTENDCCSNILP